MNDRSYIAEYRRIINKWNKKQRITMYLPGNRKAYMYLYGKIQYNK